MRELKYTEDSFISLPEDFAGHYQIPKGITKIADGAFKLCLYMKSIEIPDGITSIGNNAFWYCTKLKEIKIPEGVTSMGNNVFIFCNNLNSIRIPSTLTKVGNVFLSYTSFSDDEIASILRHIENNKTKPEAKHFTHETRTSNGMTNECKTKDNEKNKCFFYKGRKNITSYTIPNEYSIIGNGAFEGCSSLTQIEIPSSVTSIGYNAFEGCSSLTQIEIPSSVTNIGDNAFNGCSSLTQIEIPSSVTNIGGNAFNGCSTLKKIAILGNSTFIDWPLFIDCKSLEKVIIKSSRYILENGLIYNKAKTELLECISTLCDKNVVIDPKVRTINSGAFHNLENIESITLPKGLLEIEDGAFNFSDSKVNLIVQTEKIEQIEIKLDDIFKSFSNIEEGCSLTVPIGTGYAYRHHPLWGEFKTINVAPYDYGEESESEQEVDV